MNSIRSAALAIALLATPFAISAAVTAQVIISDADRAQSAIMAAGSRAATVARLTAVPSVGVVRLNFRTIPRLRDSSVPDVTEFEILAQKNYSGIRKLRAALARNPATRNALDAKGIPVARVVGVHISSNGSLRLYLL
jgi:hypothetical protein